MPFFREINVLNFSVFFSHSEIFPDDLFMEVAFAVGMSFYKSLGRFRTLTLLPFFWGENCEKPDVCYYDIHLHFRPSDSLDTKISGKHAWHLDVFS